MATHRINSIYSLQSMYFNYIAAYIQAAFEVKLLSGSSSKLLLCNEMKYEFLLLCVLQYFDINEYQYVECMMRGSYQYLYYDQYVQFIT